MASDDAENQGWDQAQPTLPLSLRYSYRDVDVPVWQKIWGVSQKKIQDDCKGLVSVMSKNASRPPTQDEVNALMDICEFRAAASSFKYPISLAMAWFFIRRGGPMKFPMVKLDPTRFHRDFFPTIQTPYLSGPPSHLMWMASRSLAYTLACSVPMGLLVDSYTTVKSAEQFRTHPGLKSFSDSIRAYRTDRKKQTNEGFENNMQELLQVPESLTKEEMIVRRDQLKSQMTALSRELSTGEGRFKTMSAHEVRRTFRSQKQALENGIRHYDQLIAAKDNPDQADRQQSDYETLSGSSVPMPMETGSSMGTTSTSGVPPQQSGWGTASTEETPAQSWSQNDGFEDDDASPVAATARTGSSAAGGSAWDRIRQQAKSQQQQPAQNSSGWGRPESDSVETRSQAQKEFDEMLERERRV